MKKPAIALTVILGSAGIGIQFYFTLVRKLSEGYGVLYSVNHFFSYFTIITNTVLTTLLLTYLLFPNSKISCWFQNTKVSASGALYIIIVGSIYYALLHNPNKPFSGEVIATHLLHGYMPLAYCGLWFLSFRKSDLKYQDAIKWLSFPSFYFIYILIRGEMIRKYPYFFIDVEKYGYMQVMFNAIGVLLVFYIVGVLIVFIDKRLKH